MNIHLLLLILGSILIIEGLPYFLFPGQLKKILKEIQNLDTKILRMLGLIFICLGLMIVYLMKSKICQ